MTTAPPNFLKFEVIGEVQGVFFRKYTQGKARELGLHGWVVNTPAGSVVGEAMGSKEKLDVFARWLREEGSPNSKVLEAKLNFESRSPSEIAFRSFEIRK